MVLPSERTGPSINTDFRAASLIHGRAAASAEIIAQDLGGRVCACAADGDEFQTLEHVEEDWCQMGRLSTTRTHIPFLIRFMGGSGVTLVAQQSEACNVLPAAGLTSSPSLSCRSLLSNIQQKQNAVKKCHKQFWPQINGSLSITLCSLKQLKITKVNPLPAC